MGKSEVAKKVVGKMFGGAKVGKKEARIRDAMVGNVDSTAYSKALVDSGYNSVKLPDVGENAYNIINKKDLRSTNAAFDPRFKDSANILALNESKAPSISGLIAKKALGAVKPKMDIGSAFGDVYGAYSDISEKLNSPRTKAIEIASKALGRELDISGGKVPGMAEQNSQILSQVAELALPDAESLLSGPGAKAFKAASMVGAKPASKVAAKVLEAAAPSKWGRTAVVETAQELAEKAPLKPVKTLFNKPSLP